MQRECCRQRTHSPCFLSSGWSVVLVVQWSNDIFRVHGASFTNFIMSSCVSNESIVVLVHCDSPYCNTLISTANKSQSALTNVALTAPCSGLNFFSFFLGVDGKYCDELHTEILPKCNLHVVVGQHPVLEYIYQNLNDRGHFSGWSQTACSTS